MGLKKAHRGSFKKKKLASITVTKKMSCTFLGFAMSCIRFYLGYLNPNIQNRDPKAVILGKKNKFVSI